jgi:hypothetical protein
VQACDFKEGANTGIELDPEFIREACWKVVLSFGLLVALVVG